MLKVQTDVYLDRVFVSYGFDGLQQKFFLSAVLFLNCSVMVRKDISWEETQLCFLLYGTFIINY